MRSVGARSLARQRIDCCHSSVEEQVQLLGLDLQLVRLMTVCCR
jgi:hypothetical protein